MLRRRTMTKAFLVGIQELEKEMGPGKTDKWMRKIGERLAELEGAGIMGEEVDGLYCFRICLFAPKLDEFIEEMGLPEGHEEILNYVKARFDDEGGPAPVNVCCAMCYAYRKKRGELSGKKDMLHLGAKYKLTGDVNVNKDVLKEAGYEEKRIKKILEDFDCVNKYLE